MITGAGSSDPGRVRRHNEDAVFSDPARGLFLVADGMGGEHAGDVAAKLAVEAVSAFIARSAQDPDHTWPFGIDGAIGYQANRLRTAVKLANRRVHREAESRAEYTGMGTTLAVVLVEEDEASIVSVGDSRVYAVRNGAIEQLTRDDTWLETLLAQNPTLDRRTLANHPMRHVLTSVVGAQDELDVTVRTRTLACGEWLILCTDGVHRALDEAALLQTIADSADPAAAAERLVASALARRGDDNASAMVLRRTPS